MHDFPTPGPHAAGWGFVELQKLAIALSLPYSTCPIHPGSTYNQQLIFSEDCLAAALFYDLGAHCSPNLCIRWFLREESTGLWRVLEKHQRDALSLGFCRHRPVQRNVSMTFFSKGTQVKPKTEFAFAQYLKAFSTRDLAGLDLIEKSRSLGLRRWSSPAHSIFGESFDGTLGMRSTATASILTRRTDDSCHRFLPPRRKLLDQNFREREGSTQRLLATRQHERPADALHRWPHPAAVTPICASSKRRFTIGLFD